MKTHRLTSLQRVIDPRYPSNRLVLLGGAIAGVFTAVAQLLDADLGLGPIAAAIAVFLAWAVARELDPDHPSAGAIAMPVSFAMLLTIGEGSLILGTAVLLSIRIAAGTVGTDLRFLDLVAVIGISAFLGTQAIGAVGLALLVAAILTFERPAGRSVAVAIAAIAAYGVVALAFGTSLVWTAPGPAEWGALSLSVLATVLIVPATGISSQTDRATGAIDRKRITTARIMAGLAVAAAFLVAGAIGIQAIAPIAGAALIGTAARRIATRNR